MQKIKTILRTYEIPDVGSTKYPIITPHNPQLFRQDMIEIAGKAAGVCYMPDDYLSNGIQDREAATKRADFTAKSGHYSTYEHGHVTFLIETNKMMAMILNSMRLYCTSEKSARYTEMKPESELEIDMYNKWTEKFEKIISGYYSETKSEKDIHKLAMENARYMISVFTPTVMEYTVPFNRAILMCEWLENIAKDAAKCLESSTINIYDDKNSNNFYSRLIADCLELRELIQKEIGITDEDHILEDHKDIDMDFINFDLTIEDWGAMNVYGDMYTTHYQGSFAMLAQAQRHRTLQYSFSFLPYESKYNSVYVPVIIRNTPYEQEWINDAKNLISNGVTIQGMLLNIREQGSFSDFVLKCKERLCSRAQLEICNNTMETLKQFLKNKNNLSKKNKHKLYSITPGPEMVLPRCKFDGYTCKEPCSLGARGLCRNI